MRAALLMTTVLGVASAGAAAPAGAQTGAVTASATDPVDAPASGFDITGLTVVREPDSSTRVTVTFATPVPSAPGSLVRIDVSQTGSYVADTCTATQTGDLAIAVDDSGSHSAAVGREAEPRTVGFFSVDRRTLTITVDPSADPSRRMFCARAVSDDGSGHRDETTSAYFPPFVPGPALPLAGGNGTTTRGVVPSVAWSSATNHGETDTFAFYEADPATGAAPVLRTPMMRTVNGRLSNGQRVDVTAWSGFAALTPRWMPTGTYWWTVTRDFGAGRVFSLTQHFTVGAPPMTTLVLRRAVTPPPTSRSRGRAEIRLLATAGSTVQVTVTRDGTPVTTRTFPGTLQLIDKIVRHRKDPPVLVLQISCRRPGTYAVTAVATDPYGTSLTATKGWTVSAERCARLRRAEARARG